MPKLTDYVREGFKRRARPWDRAELPEWWDLAMWAGLAGVILMLVVGALLDRGGTDRPPGGTAGGMPPYAVQSLNPYASAGSGTRPGPRPPAGTGTASPMTSTDFAATAPARVQVTGGGTTVVPAGARNVALAAARATATGDWSGIPYIGTGRPPKAKKTPAGSVVGALTVADPATTGNAQYLFSATVRHGAAARPYLVRIAVERGVSGYAVRAP